jgi:hypothetical protein
MKPDPPCPDPPLPHPHPQHPYPRYLDWLRYISAFLLLGYGSSKLAHLQFHLNQALAQRPVSSLTGFQLTWYYYGYSRVYSIILGLTQIIGAALLLFRKSALGGAVLMMPVVVNILLPKSCILTSSSCRPIADQRSRLPSFLFHSHCSSVATFAISSPPSGPANCPNRSPRENSMYASEWQSSSPSWPRSRSESS